MVGLVWATKPGIALFTFGGLFLFEIPTSQSIPVLLLTHLDLFDDAEPADYLPEDDVLVVEPIRLLSRDEELRPVRARPRVGHREDPRLSWGSSLLIRPG